MEKVYDYCASVKHAGDREVLLGHVFYGWVIVGAGFVIPLVSYGVQFSYSLLLPFLVNEFGGKGTKSRCVYGLHLVYSGLAPIAGKIIDSDGPKKTIVIGGCLTFIWNRHDSQTVSLWNLYLFLGSLRESA